MSIIHYLTIQSCKRVFFDPDYGVMRSTEPLAEDTNLSIKPLCLLGISVDNLPLKFTKYYHKDDPAISLSAFVKTFWDRVYKVSGFNNPIVTGMPDLLVIDHRAKHLIQDNFFEWLKLNKIEYMFSDSKNRTALAKYLQHQDYPRAGLFKDMTEDNSYKTTNEQYALSVDVLNYHENYFDFINPVTKHLKTLNLYQKNIFKPRFPLEPLNNDIDLKGILPLPSKADRKLEAAYWVRGDLEKGDYGYLHNRLELDIADSERLEKKAFIAALKALPETQWQSMFTDDQIGLINILKKERYKDTRSLSEKNYREMCYQLGFDDHSQTTLAFDTKNLTRSEMIELWDEYTHGGNVTFSSEILLPPWKTCRNGKTYRFFYLSSDNKSLFFVCTPDSAAAKAFDDEGCTNHMVNNIYEIRQINEHINLDFFDEMLLNTRQYLIFMALEMRKFHTQILNYYY